MYYVYIVQCSDGTYYTGYTTNLDKRIKAHNEGKTGAKYTRTRRPVILKYSENYKTLGEALKREYQLKKLTKQEKKHLITSA